MPKALKEVIRIAEHLLRGCDAVKPVAAVEQSIGFQCQIHACFEIIHHRDLAVVVGAVHIRQFDCGAAVTTV